MVLNNYLISKIEYFFDAAFDTSPTLEPCTKLNRPWLPVV